MARSRPYRNLRFHRLRRKKDSAAGQAATAGFALDQIPAEREV